MSTSPTTAPAVPEGRGPGRTRWPLGLLGMLAILAATERYIAGRDIDLGTLEAIEWRLTGKAVARRVAGAKLLGFGTSLSHVGVSPRILGERTGRPTYNLALSGGQPYAAYTMLRHALEAGAKPEAILVDFKWTAVAINPIGLERILPEVASLAECARLALEMRDGSYLGRIALVEGLPSFRCREQVRKNIAAALKGEEPIRNEQASIMARNMRVNLGSQHAPVTGFDGAIDPKDEHMYPPAWAPHPINDRYVHAFLDLAESRSIPVFWLVPPVSPAAQARLDAVGASARYTAFVRGCLARYPGLTVLDGRGSAYPAGAFIDPSHLNRRGAADLSNALADAIKARLDGGGSDSGRWVSLPSYRGGQGAEALEDYVGSHERLVAAERAREESRRVAGATPGGARR